MQQKRIALLALLALGLSHIALAGEKEEIERVRTVLATLVEAKPDRISPSVVKGLYEAAFGPKLYLVSADGRYLIDGELIDIEGRRSLTEEYRARLRRDLMAGVKDKEVIVYKAKGKEKHVISVFTDIDCTYCRKLHSEMPRLNELGITVRYLAFPRAGERSPSYDKAVSVWCARDRNKAMDEAKNSDRITAAKCDNPVSAQMALGMNIGVSGTPAIIFPDGQLAPGYMPADRLLAELDKAKASP